MPTVACYCRVSTSEQNLDRQLTSTSEYAEREFDAGVDDLEIYRDKSTGTDTARSGYREMMDDAESGAFDAVVVHSISRICRSVRDLDRTASRLKDAGVELHIISEALTLRPGDEVNEPAGRPTRVVPRSISGGRPSRAQLLSWSAILLPPSEAANGSPHEFPTS